MFYYDYPSPDEVLRIGPARNVAAPPCTQQLIRLEKQVLMEVTRQTKSGRQLGTSVCVYLHGRMVLYVLAGVFRHSHDFTEAGCWRPVDEHTLFMSYSVAKGVTAMALLSFVDRGMVSYEDRVADFWPEFAATCESKWNITVGDAVSHRAGLGSSLPPFSLHVLLSSLRGFWLGDWRVSWTAGESFVEQMSPEFRVGEFARYHPVSYSWIMGGILQRVLLRWEKKKEQEEKKKEQEEGGTKTEEEGEQEEQEQEVRSRVHVVKSVSDIVRDTVGLTCACRQDIFVGVLSQHQQQQDQDQQPDLELTRVALLEPLPPSLYHFPNPMSELSFVSTLLQHPPLCHLPACLKYLLSTAVYFCLVLLAVVEGRVFSALGNSDLWRGMCLPSSNGYFTSQAVAVMYGALANGGVVEIVDQAAPPPAPRAPPPAPAPAPAEMATRQVRVFSEEVVQRLFAQAAEVSRARPMHAWHTDRASWGRHTKGFSPWPLPSLHGERHEQATLGHQGMGGCSSFGCAETGLAVCIMRTVYDPLLISEGAVKLDDGRLSRVIREVLLGSEQDQQAGPAGPAR